MKLYYINVYERHRQVNDYIEAENLMEALKQFHQLHQIDQNYNDLHIKRIYRQMQMTHTIEQIARRNKHIIKQKNENQRHYRNLFE